MRTDWIQKKGEQNTFSHRPSSSHKGQRVTDRPQQSPEKIPRTYETDYH
jgi:hypothetical protein